MVSWTLTRRSRLFRRLFRRLLHVVHEAVQFHDHDLLHDLHDREMDLRAWPSALAARLMDPLRLLRGHLDLRHVLLCWSRGRHLHDHLTLHHGHCRGLLGFLTFRELEEKSAQLSVNTSAGERNADLRVPWDVQNEWLSDSNNHNSVNDWSSVRDDLIERTLY